MAYVITGTIGLCIWIVVWALRVSGFDGFLIVVVMLLIVGAIRNVAPHLTSRKDHQ